MLSCQFLTTDVWVQSKDRLCRICGEQSGTGRGFIWVLQISPLWTMKLWWNTMLHNQPQHLWNTAGNKCYHAVCHLLKKRYIYITPALKAYLYVTLTGLMVTYGAEPWNLSNTMESLNDMWEELRKIYGLTYTNGYWRTKINQEIQIL